MTIAVDFDGTIVEHRYPAIGKQIPFAMDTLRALIADGHHVILWTVREGKLLQDAIDFCRECGLEFYAVNSNFPEEEPRISEPASVSPARRKVTADLYIDDRNLGGLPDWGIIYQIVHGHRNFEDYYREAFSSQPEPEPSFFQRLFGKH